MELYLKREENQTKTFGRLYEENIYLNETLEDKVRSASDPFILKETAIPYGRYRLIISFSNRFKKQMIQIINVRGSNILYHGVSVDACGLRLHGGNTEEDTLGCVLCGKTRTLEGIKDCKIVVDNLIKLVKSADKKEEVYLNIVKA